MPEYSLEDLQAELSNREVSTESRQQQALDYFQTKGWQPHQAAGIVGNLFHESGLKTSAVGDKGASLGIAQWGGPRRKALHEFASQRGTSPYDFNTQLEFINHELSTGEGSAGDALRRAGNTAQATQVFSRYYERPGKPMMGSRLAAARRLEKMMDVTGAKTPSGEPTLEDLEAELARREGGEPQAEVTLADLEAELARREGASVATAEQATGAITQKALGKLPPTKPEVTQPGVTKDQVLGRLNEPLAAETAFEPPVFPQREAPAPAPVPTLLPDPRLTPGATEHLTGRISPEPMPTPTIPPELAEIEKRESEEAWKRSQLAQPAGMPPYSKVELMTKEGQLAPEPGAGDPFQPADIPAFILGPGIGSKLAGATMSQVLKGMTKSIAPTITSFAAMEAAVGAMENQPFYQQFPLSLAAGVLAGTVTHRLGRMVSPTVLRQTAVGGKPVQVSPDLFKAEITQRVTAGMDYKTALHDVAQKYGSSIDELLATAGTPEFQQVAKGSGAAAGAEAAETLKEMKPTTGKEETFVAEEKPPSIAEGKVTAAQVEEIGTKVADEFLKAAKKTYGDDPIAIKYAELEAEGLRDAAKATTKLPEYVNEKYVWGRYNLHKARGIDDPKVEKWVEQLTKEGKLPLKGEPTLTPTPTQPEIVPPAASEKVVPEVQAGTGVAAPIAEEGSASAKFTKFLDKVGYRFASDAKGQYILDELETRGINPQDVHSEFWEKTYPNLTPRQQKYFEKYVEKLSGFKKGDVIGTLADGSEWKAESWGELIDLPPDVTELQGTERGLLAMEAYANNFKVKPRATLETPAEPLALPATPKPEPVTVRTVGEVYQDPDGWYRIEGSENKFQRKVEADKAAATIKKYQDVFEEQLEKGNTQADKLAQQLGFANKEEYIKSQRDAAIKVHEEIIAKGGKIGGGLTDEPWKREQRVKDAKRAIEELKQEQPSVKPFSPILDEEGFIDMSFLRSPIQFVADMLTQAQSGLGPGAISPEHLKAAEVAGSHLGALHRRGESAAVQLKPFRRMMDKMGVTDPSIPLETNRGVQFMSDMTKPGQSVAAGLEPIRDKISELFGKRLAELRRVGKPLNDVRANYFPGMWTRESRLAFNQAMDEAVWTQGRGLDPTGRLGSDVLPIDLWTNADKAWVKARVEELLKVGGGSDTKDMISYMARRPLAGRETFRKPKVFDDIMTGIEFGLKPISNNPVDLALLKMAEMDRSIWAHGVMKELRGTGDVKFVRTTQKPPPGFVDLDAGRPYAQVYGAYDPKTGARPLYGRWTAKAPAAMIIDNYLSQSLYNSATMGKAYQSLMFGANLLNQWQLMSFFHAGFTTFETQISAGAQILKDLYGVVRGNRSLGDLGNTIKQYPQASTKFVREGNRTLTEWANPSINVPDNVPISRLAPNTPEAAIVAKAAELAGGGFGMERRWQTHWLDKFIKEVHGGQKVKGALRSPVVFSEMMMKPVLEWLVPRQKAAVFGDMVGRLLEQNPGKTLQELRPQLRQTWNRVDSRLGQVRYDRMFMKESTKNLMQGLVRAPGWTGGTIAEIGGSPLDAGRWLKEWAQTGKIPADMPDRVAYTMSLLGTMGLANAMTTLAYDRLSDKPFLKGDNLWAKVKSMDPMDWVAFRTGDKHPDGREVRYLYPTYMKDLFAWYEDIKNLSPHTLVAKLHPIWSLAGDLARNKDYYNTIIANPRDPLPTRGMDIGKYILKSFLPFGVRGMMNVTGESDVLTAMKALPQELREEPGKVIAPQFGIMPAPRAMTATPFMKAMDEVFSRAGKPTLTPKEAEALREKHRVVVLNAKGKIDEAEAKMDELREKGELTKQKEKNLRRKMAEPQTYLFKQVKNIDDAIYAWDKASPEEKSFIAGEMEKKLRNLQKRNKAKYADMESEAERIWGELDNIERQSEAEKNVRKGRWSVEMGAEYMSRGATKQ